MFVGNCQHIIRHISLSFVNDLLIDRKQILNFREIVHKKKPFTPLWA